MDETKNEFYDWVAVKLIEDLRRGVFPEKPPKIFIFYPFMDCIWEKVKESDKKLIITLLNSSENLRWGILLSRKLSEDNEIKEVLVKLLKTIQNEEIQLALFHELTYRKNDANLNKLLFDFLCNHFQFYLDWEKKYFGDSIIEKCKARMDNPNFINKRWVYLFSVHASENTEEIRHFINDYIHDPDPFLAEIAQKSLNLLGKKS